MRPATTFLFLAWNCRFSICAAVLSAVQEFYGFADEAEKHKKASVSFYVIKRNIDIFRSLYADGLGNTTLSQDELQAARQEERAILDFDRPAAFEEYEEAVDNAPILVETGQQQPQRARRKFLNFERHLADRQQHAIADPAAAVAPEELDPGNEVTGRER